MKNKNKIFIELNNLVLYLSKDVNISNLNKIITYFQKIKLILIIIY